MPEMAAMAEAVEPPVAIGPPAAVGTAPRKLYVWAAELAPIVGAAVAIGVVSVHGRPTHAIVTFWTMAIATAFGVGLGFHRLFSHRSFATFPAVECALMILGCMATVSRGPFLWVATHRIHHRHSDREGDPHSPHGGTERPVGLLRRFWHAHSGWAYTYGHVYPAAVIRDLRRRPHLVWIDRYWLLWLALGLILPGLVGFLVGGTAYDALIGFLWGGVLRHFVVLQMPLVVNAVCHLWGPRPYDTPDQSRNSFLLGVLALGDGWHNNHHAFPSSARHGFYWWQPDLIWCVIWLMERAGLAWDVKRPDLLRASNAKGAPSRADAAAMLRRPDLAGQRSQSHGAWMSRDTIVASRPKNTDAGSGRIVDWLALTWAIGCHLLALLIFVPWFFSWTGVVLLVVGIHLFGMIGINLGYHRLLTHRSFSSPRWLERTLAILGVCCAQEAPASWVAIHRRHHQFADKEQDPHTPRDNFFWGHIGWIALKGEDMFRGPLTQRYASDLLRDPFYAWLETSWQAVVLCSWLVFVAAGLAVGLLIGTTTQEALQFTASVFVWGVAARTVYVWHVSCFVNSVSHRWGYRSYDTNDDSRNNLFVGYFAHGEGWHNNHHAEPRAALHGRRVWEFDPVFWIIRLLAAVGLARDVVMPRLQR